MKTLPISSGGLLGKVQKQWLLHPVVDKLPIEFFFSLIIKG